MEINKNLQHIPKKRDHKFWDLNISDAMWTASNHLRLIALSCDVGCESFQLVSAQRKSHWKFSLKKTKTYVLNILYAGIIHIPWMIKKNNNDLKTYESFITTFRRLMKWDAGEVKQINKVEQIYTKYNEMVLIIPTTCNL